MQYEQKHKNNYIKFSAMIATAMVAMFFLTYNHSYQIISRSSRISAFYISSPTVRKIKKIPSNKPKASAK
jgi:hypothetical protein